MISEQEAVIVKELLIHAVSDEKIFVDWFNDSIAKNDYSRIVELCSSVNEVLFNLAKKDYCVLKIKSEKIKVKVENKTCARWSEAIKASLNYDTAFFMIKAHKTLEVLCSAILPLKHFVRMSEGSEYFAEQVHPIRQWMLLGLDKERDFENMSISKLLENCYTQCDYINLIMTVMKYVIMDARKKSVRSILGFVNGKKENKWNKVSDSVDVEMLASDELKRFQNIYEFLKNDPELLSDIEEKTGEKGLLEFFHVEKE